MQAILREIESADSSGGAVPHSGAAAPQPPASQSPPSQSPPPLPYIVTNSGIELPESEGNAFHLCVVIRKYTSAKLTFIGGQRVTRVENALLWDALGLLRSLRYDVDRFNSAADGTGRSREEVRYAEDGQWSLG